MTALARSLAVVGMLGVFSAPLSAQWPEHKDPRAPRTADGKVDLTAPAPRTADGKPDLSGIWQNAGRGQGAPR